jgi:hypothetical protein
MFKRIGSATEAQAEVEKLTSVWSPDTALILMVVVYCAFKLEEIITKLNAQKGPYG